MSVARHQLCEPRRLLTELREMPSVQIKPSQRVLTANKDQYSASPNKTHKLTTRGRGRTLGHAS